MSRWTRKKQESTEAEIYPTVLEGIKKIYASKVKPLEALYNFDVFHTPLLRDSDFDAKPMVLLLGQYSTGNTQHISNESKYLLGKTSFIRYLLETEYPGAVCTKFRN